MRKETKKVFSSVSKMVESDLLMKMRERMNSLAYSILNLLLIMLA